MTDKRVAAFEDLEVFQRAYRLSLEIHRKSLGFPRIEQHVLGDRLRRASKSICANIAEGFAKQGLHPAWFWAHYIGCLEFLGGICLILGLLTRPVAALFAGFMFVAAFHVHMQIGWFWTNRGMEVPFYLLLICLAILIRGGGPLSLDSRLPREI